MNVPSPTSRAADILLIAVVCALVHGYGIGRMHLKHEEPRRAIIAQEMIDTGEWFVPRLMGAPYLAKPPVFNWLIALCAIPDGDVDESAARLPSVVSVFGIALIVYLLGRSVVNRQAALLASLMFITCGLVLEKGSMAEIDMNFTFWVTASLAFLFRAYSSERKSAADWPLAYFFLSVASLTKGPPALLFFVAGLGSLAWLHRSLKPLAVKSHLLGLVVFGIPIALWLLAVHRDVGLNALLETAYSETIARSGSMSLLNPISWLVYPGELFLAFLPWSLFLLLAIPAYRMDPATSRTRLTRFALLCTLGSVVLFSFSPGKAARYLLPVLPLLALGAGDGMDRFLARAYDESWLRKGRIISWTMAAVLGLGVVAIGVVAGGDWEAPPIAVGVLCALTLCAAAAAFVGLSRGRPLALVGALVAVACIYRVGYVTYYVPKSNEERSVALITQGIEDIVPPGDPIYSVFFNNHTIVYYLERPVRRLESLEALVEKGERSGEVYFLLMQEEPRELDDLQPGTWRPYFTFTAKGLDSALMGREELHPRKD